jgi:hypothetical protein
MKNQKYILAAGVLTFTAGALLKLSVNESAEVFAASIFLLASSVFLNTFYVVKRIRKQ